MIFLLYSYHIDHFVIWIKRADCCDGSDEYDGKVKCTYSCHEAGKVAMESLKRKVEMYQEGVVLRKVEIGLAKRAIARDKAELSGLKIEREVVEKFVHRLEGMTPSFLFFQFIIYCS